MNTIISTRLRFIPPIFVFTVLLGTFTSFNTSRADESPQPQLTAGAYQAPYLVKDINTYSHGIEIFNPVELDGVFYFVSRNWYYGTVLYRSDGTDAGTSIVWRIYPDYLHYPTRLAVLNGSLYFAAYDEATGYELYKSDGTAAGTSLVKDINPDSDGLPAYMDMMLTIFNDLLFFSADDGTTGNELWVTDGTEAGTRLVKDIAPGVPEVPPYSSNPYQGTILNNVLFFFADDGVHGVELWKTDGSTAGTVLVKDIFQGENSSRPTYLPYPDESQDQATATVNGKLFFAADDGVHGAEIWMSDGTELGTVMVKDIYSGIDKWGQPYSSNARYFLTYNDRLYFTAQDEAHGQELWQSDGTDPGTIILKDIYPGATQGCYECSRHMAELDGLLYFPAYDNIHGDALWRTNGTPAGTQFALVSSVDGPSHGFRSLVTQNGVLYFFSGTDSYGEELFTSDGTQAGTWIVKDINPGVGSATSWNDPILFPDSLNRLYLLADDGTHGPELWISDGSEAGTALVKDINTLTEDSVGLGFPAVGINNVLYFLAHERVHGLELWKSDGTEANTLLVKDIAPGTSVINSYGSEWLAVGETLFFTVDDGTHGYELWRTDGTEAGTEMVRDIHPAGSSEPNSLAELDGWLYFSADDGQHGAELWKSDGSTAGTVLVKDIHPTGSSGPVNLIVVNGVLYFAADDGEHGYELWRSDGTPAGTRLVIDIQPGQWSSGPGLLTESGGRLFFGADDGKHGVELWVSDGSKSGTEMVKDIYPGDYAWPSLLTDVNGTLFFTAIDASHGRELWKSDGTEKGTRLVLDIYPDSSTVYVYAPLNLTSLNGKLYFSAVLVEWGRELWVSDGSELGTYMVRDIKPGNGDGFPGWANLSPLVTTENVVLFTGSEFLHGDELWQSDGTFNGTQMVVELNPSIYASPFLIGNAGGTVFFAGNDTLHGYELWAYRYVLNRVYMPVMLGNLIDTSD